MDNVKERFLAKVDKTDTCWLWVGSKDPRTKYGQFHLEGKTQLAHRVAFKLFKGGSQELCVCHTCDNPPCVNPDHLFSGSHKENTNDMMAKGRASCANHRGSSNPNSKLTEKEAKEILELGRRKSRNEIAKSYGISVRTVSDIRNGRTWKYLVS